MYKLWKKKALEVSRIKFYTGDPKAGAGDPNDGAFDEVCEKPPPNVDVEDVALGDCCPKAPPLLPKPVGANIDPVVGC